MPQFNFSLIYIIIVFIIIFLINMITLNKKIIILINFSLKKKFHLLNHLWFTILSISNLLLDINYIFNNVFSLLIKLLKLNNILENIKNYDNIYIFKLYDLNFDLFFYRKVNQNLNNNLKIEKINK